MLRVSIAFGTNDDEIIDKIESVVAGHAEEESIEWFKPMTLTYLTVVSKEDATRDFTDEGVDLDSVSKTTMTYEE